MFVDASTMIVLGLYFMFFKSMTPLFVLNALGMRIIIVLIQVCIPESPKYLYESDKMEEFFEALLRISKGNGLSLTIEDLKQM